MDNNIDKKKKRLKLYYGLLITLICMIGVSFAWFRLYLSQSEDNTVATRTCFSTTLTENTSKISLTDAFPISDEDGLKQSPFTFTIKNNCDSYVKAYITIDSTYRESTDTSYIKDNYIKVNVSPKDTKDGSSKLLGGQILTDLENNRKGYIIVRTSLDANEEKSFDLRIWMDSKTTLEQGLNKNWAGKIVVVSNASSGLTLTDAILVNNEVKETITEPGKEVSAHIASDVVKNYDLSISGSYHSYYVTYGTGYEANGDKIGLTGATVTSDTYAKSYSSLVGKYLPASDNVFSPEKGFLSDTAGTILTTTNLNKIFYVVKAELYNLTLKEITSNKNASEAVLASSPDDYGTSYYFRGAVTNNYVQFANKCWRIVRITGDDSVKLVLHNDNTDNSNNPCSSVNNKKGAAFANYSNKDDSYSSSFNKEYAGRAYVGFMYGNNGADTYGEVLANINKSTILTNLENWYEQNLSSYENSLSDVIWCNDKSTLNGFPSVGGTDYMPYYRIKKIKTPTLICPNDDNGGKLSKFTVNDTINGNGDLTYKIGLLTADEVVFAGFYPEVVNKSVYLAENTGEYSNWWTLSPSDASWAVNWAVYSDDYVRGYNVTNGAELRPAIALTSDVTISGGTGTSEDPYVVK